MRVVLTGASGQLGGYVAQRLCAAGFEAIAWSGAARGERAGVPLRPVDLTDLRAVAQALAEADPAAIIHAAAVSAIDAVRLDPARARAVNVASTRFLADWCDRHDRRLVYTSTDLVFDGRRGWYRETDPPEPVMAYGRTKRDGEEAVLERTGGVVARTSLLYGAARGGKPTYIDRTIAALRRGEPQTFFEDELRTPLDLATAADVLVQLADSDLAGLVHVGGRERVSRFDLSRRIAAALGLDSALVKANRQSDVRFAEPRPADVSLDSSRLASILPDLRRPTIEEAIVAMMT
jgi:dTDP-4-dehydrorhamnose reductase